jgi:uncharacterized membrane protein YwaF
VRKDEKVRKFDMTWGSFGAVHLGSLAVAAVLLVALYFILKQTSAKVQTIVLGILSFSGIAAIIFNLVMWESPLEYLPLHLCSLNALVLPVAVLTRSKTLNNLLLVWSLGALAALVVNTAQADFVLFSDVFCFYFFPHVLEFGIPILMFCLGLTRKDIRCIGSTLGITVVVYTLIHLFNVWLNGYCQANQILDYAGNVIQVNYMYSISPANPVLQLFWNWLPQPYWYMFFIFPIVGIYLLGIYARQLKDLLKKKKVHA